MTPLARQLRLIARGSRVLGGSGTQGRRRSVRRSRSSPAPVAGPATENGRLSRVEAVLFLAKEPLSLRRITQLASLADATEARTLVDQLARQYGRRGRSFQIENIAGGYRMLTRSQFAPWLGKLGDLCDLDASQLKLTPPALDTLTVVAYRQPVLRSEVEAIRGVGCGELLRQLIERDLLRIVGRSEELGRPLQYGTTKRFLQLFGLKSLNELPPLEGPDRSLQEEPANESSREPSVAPRAA